MRDKIIDLVRGKHVHIATHWDADGVTSGALMYHMILPHAKKVTKISKGKTFLIEPSDVDPEAEIVICTDIQPSKKIKDMPLCPKIAYIDHHPSDTLDYAFVLHNPSAVSTSMLIYDNLFQDTEDPYIVFLALVGYFGDRGSGLPPHLEGKARRLLGNLLELRPSNFGKPYFEIERFVSLFNTGKRMNWCGNEPLELLTSVSRIESLFMHELFSRLNSYKQELSNVYSMDVNVNKIGNIDLIFIANPKNIQGVIAARHMDGRPIIVINHYEDELIGSMRVPDGSNFDAGTFLERFNGRIPNFLGGGHEKAAGFNMPVSEIDEFASLLREFAEK